MQNIRNIGISAHIDSGKTTFTERVLYYAGRINSIHEVKGSDGVGATMDFMELEKERGITIQSAATQLQWRDHHINLIDTPGHVDFTIEVERALRVLDGAVLIVCGVSGVQAQTFTVYKQMQRYNVPRIIFINKLDRLGANVYRTIDQIKQRLGINTELTQIPIGEDESFSGIIDLIQMKCYAFEGPNGNQIKEQQIPDNMLKQSQQRRQQLLETLADNNEELMEKLLDEQEISVQEIKDIIRQQTLSLQFAPIFIGSAYKNKGVQSALDGVLDYLPSPQEVKQHGFVQIYKDGKLDEQQIDLQCDNKKQFVCLAFKLEENRFGQLTFCRVYQGKIKQGDTIWNVKDQKQVKISRMVQIHADKIEDIKEAKAGDIFALFGIECSSGTTFIKNHKEQIINLSTMFIPDPVISVSLKAENKNNLQNLQKALTRFSKEDPTFTFSVDPESEQMIISGMGELHLQIYCERIKREYNTKVQIGQPIVSYRETVISKVDYNYLHKKQSGGAGQFAKIIGDVQPLNDLETATQDQLFSNLFVNEVKGQSIPMEYVTAVEKQFYESCNKGPLTGYPMINLQFTLRDGLTHVVDSSQTAFQTATKYALRQVFNDSSATLLEPTMKVEISVPVESYQPVMNSITKRGGNIISTQTSGEYFILEAKVTLENMFGFSSELRGFTQGQGEFSMEYLNHTPVPIQRQQEIIDKIKDHRKNNQINQYILNQQFNQQKKIMYQNFKKKINYYDL